jgi:uncharacterized protein YecE (DUF72 family)
MHAADRNTIHVGTSGWHYMHWKERFYPEEIKPQDWLAYYTQFFKTVEINSTFYRMPKAQTFRQWKKTVPDDFLFVVKANRYITHQKKLLEPYSTLPTFFEGISILEEKLGPILFQLPPSLHIDLERMEIFLEALPEGFQYAFEFRSQSWFQPEVYQLLRQFDAALCLHELAGFKAPVEVTAELIYVRLHGPGQNAYQGSYSDNTLASWSKQFAEWLKTGKSIFCFFDNDEKAYAVRNALTLQDMCKNLGARVTLLTAYFCFF